MRVLDDDRRLEIALEDEVNSDLSLITQQTSPNAQFRWRIPQSHIIVNTRRSSTKSHRLSAGHDSEPSCQCDGNLIATRHISSSRGIAGFPAAVLYTFACLHLK